MVKFSKQFEGQLVPEWKEAFVDYWQLKKDIKKLQAAGGGAEAAPPSQCQPPPAAHWVMRLPLPFLHPLGHHKEHHGAIQVHRKLANADGEVAGEVYETEVLDGGFAAAEAGAAKAFFERLDQQLNKVNRFYERKEGEFLERGESLRRQLQILVELRAAVTEQQRERRRGGGSSAGSTDPEDPSVSCSIHIKLQEINPSGASQNKNKKAKKISPKMLLHRAPTKKGRRIRSPSLKV